MEKDIRKRGKSNTESIVFQPWELQQDVQKLRNKWKEISKKERLQI